MKIKAVIFDMDGVLIDAKEWHYEALNKALGLFGYEITRAEHASVYDGLPTKTKLKRMSVDKGLPNALHGFISEMKQQYTLGMIFNYCRPRFSHEYALSKLKSEGYKIALGSNSVRPSVDAMLQKANLEKYFDITISNQDVSKSKPDPEMYSTIIDRLHVFPEECVICEDNDHGIKAALASGAHLFKVGSVNDVTYDNISKRIAEIERGRA